MFNDNQIVHTGILHIIYLSIPGEGSDSVDLPEVSSIAHPVGNQSHVACAVEYILKNPLG